MRIGYRWLIGVLSIVIPLTEFHYDLDNHTDEVAFGRHNLLQHVKASFNQSWRQLWMGKHILYHINSRQSMFILRRERQLTDDGKHLPPPNLIGII